MTTLVHFTNGLDLVCSAEVEHIARIEQIAPFSGMQTRIFFKNGTETFAKEEHVVIAGLYDQARLSLARLAYGPMISAGNDRS